MYNYAKLKQTLIDESIVSLYNPVFDSVLMRKVSQSAPVVDCETFVNFTNARYTIYFLVCEQIFLILAIGTICFDVQNPNASCRASVISVLV